MCSAPPHVAERSEKDLIASFVDKIAALSPQLITFNGSSFDLPVLALQRRDHLLAQRVVQQRPPQQGWPQFLPPRAQRMPEPDASVFVSIQTANGTGDQPGSSSQRPLG